MDVLKPACTRASSHGRSSLGLWLAMAAAALSACQAAAPPLGSLSQEEQAALDRAPQVPLVGATLTSSQGDAAEAESAPDAGEAGQASPGALRIWVATLTLDHSGAGTTSPQELVASDRVAHELSLGTLHEPRRRGMGSLHHGSLSLEEPLDLDTLRLSLHARGGDLWLSQLWFGWGLVGSGEEAKLLPLGMEPRVFGLSSDPGDLETPTWTHRLPTWELAAAPGHQVQSLILVLQTSDEPGAGTLAENVELQVGPFHYRLPKEPQGRLQRGAANVYQVQLLQPISIDALRSDQRGIQLKHQAQGAWLPAACFLFGVVRLPDADAPGLVHPLVHEPDWSQGWLGAVPGEEAAGSADLELTSLHEQDS